MDSEYGIEAGTLADVPQILALMEEYWRFEGIGGFEQARAAALLRHLLSRPHLGTVWAARAAGRVVGYLIAVLVFSFEYQGLVAEIDELFVSPQARRDGIGTALLEVAEALHHRGNGSVIPEFSFRLHLLIQRGLIGRIIL